MSGLITEMHRVVTDVIGDDSQATAVVFALIKAFGGERVYIPHNDYALRNNEIKALHAAGAEVEKLAKRYLLSEKTIYRILSTE